MRYSSIAFVLAGALLVPVVASAIDVRMPGRTGLVRFGEQSGILKSQKSISKPLKGTSFPFPAASGPDDPRTVGGTWRRCIVGQAGPCDKIPLDASRWVGLGNPAGSKGWKYKGLGIPADPCTTVVIKRNVVRAICKGDGGIDDDFVLPVGASNVGDELIIGSMRYCNEFEPPYVKDGGDKQIWKKKVKSKLATEPVACPSLDPPPPPYGSASEAFVAPRRGLLD